MIIMDSVEVGNISDLTTMLKNREKELLKDNLLVKSTEFWFRGQSNYQHDLIPTIFRERYDEAAMYAEFIKRFPEHSNNHKNVFEWLTLMQHYKLPTRLLDWTTNLLVALFFCCNDEENKDKDGAIFIFIPLLSVSFLNPFSFECDYNHPKLLDTQLLEPLITSATKEGFLSDVLEICSEFKEYQIRINDFDVINANRNSIQSSIISKDGRSTFKVTSNSDGSSWKKNPLYSWYYPYKPSHKNPRIRQQQGCFTFHGGKYFGKEEFIAMSKMEDGKKSLIKIKISASSKEKILKELKLLGINEATLFPEMEYQAKQIKEIYKLT